MLSNTIRVLDFDKSVVRQSGLISKYQAKIINFADIGPDVRLWLNNKTKLQMES